MIRMRLRMRIRMMTMRMMMMVMMMMMMMMLMTMTMRRRRSRKMMMLRRMMLRRKTDPKTGKHTLCEPALSKWAWTEYKSHLVWKFTGKTTGTPLGTPFCASLRSRNARVEISRKNLDADPGDTILCEPSQSKCTWTFPKSHFCGNLPGKCPTPIPRKSFCASLRSRNAHGHFPRAIFVEIYQENAQRQFLGHRFVRACAVETHMDISQEPFCVEIYRENAKRPGYHLDLTPGLNC